MKTPESQKVICPQCEGKKVITVYETIAVCCRYARPDGTCCGLPVPEEKPIGEDTCPNCIGEGEIILTPTI